MTTPLLFLLLLCLFYPMRGRWRASSRFMRPSRLLLCLAVFCGRFICEAFFASGFFPQRKNRCRRSEKTDALLSSNAKGGTTSSSEVGKLVFFLLAIVATVVVLSLSSTNDFEDEHIMWSSKRHHRRSTRRNSSKPSLPKGRKRDDSSARKSPTSGSGSTGRKRVCERAKMNKVFAHTVGACAFEKDSSIYRRQKKTTFGVFGGGRFGRRR